MNFAKASLLSIAWIIKKKLCCYIMLRECILLEHRNRLAINKRTCCKVNLLAMLPLPASVLWGDNDNSSSWVLHPNSLAALVRATKEKNNRSYSHEGIFSFSHSLESKGNLCNWPEHRSRIPCGYAKD